MPKSALARFLLKGQSICKGYAKAQAYAKSGPKQLACKKRAKSAAMQRSCQRQSLANIMPVRASCKNWAKSSAMQKACHIRSYAKAMPSKALCKSYASAQAYAKGMPSQPPCKIHASLHKAEPAASSKSPQAKASRGGPPSGECSPLHKCLLRTNQFFRLYQADSAQNFIFQMYQVDFCCFLGYFGQRRIYDRLRCY